MAKQKDLAGKDKEPQVRGKSGPSSATTEKRQGRARKRDASRGVPRVGKHDTGKSDSSGGELH
jgi:hypothetical protein